jgi:hypothetical protein
MMLRVECAGNVIIKARYGTDDIYCACSRIDPAERACGGCEVKGVQGIGCVVILKTEDIAGRAIGGWAYGTIENDSGRHIDGIEIPGGYSCRIPLEKETLMIGVIGTIVTNHPHYARNMNQPVNRKAGIVHCRHVLVLGMATGNCKEDQSH